MARRRFRRRLVRWSDSSPAMDDATNGGDWFNPSPASEIGWNRTLWTVGDTSNVLERCIIHRIVGRILIYNGAIDPISEGNYLPPIDITWGIKKYQSQSSTSTNSTSVHLGIGNSNGLDWMILRTLTIWPAYTITANTLGVPYLTPNGNPANNFTDPGSYYDIKVKRRLEDGEGLGLWVQVAGPGNGARSSTWVRNHCRILYSISH